jgi:hypothetical protein
MSDSSPIPRISLSLTDGNRLSMIAWSLTGDCLVELWPNGNLRHLVPLAQIVAIEVADGD